MAIQKTIQGFKLNLLLVAIALSAFLISLDSFIINVAITTISGQLGVRQDVGTWMITLFTVTNTLFVPVAGRLSQIYGNKPIFLIGVFVFGVASILCGLSTTFTMLLCFRIIQGAGAGLILPVSLSLIVAYFPPEKRNVAVGFWSFFVFVGPAMGPMTGGWVSGYDWSWLFYLNVPFVIFSFVTVWFILKKRTEPKTALPLDWIGLILLFLGVGALQIALNRGQIDDWFRSYFIVTLFIITVIAIVFFLAWELFYSKPFIDLSHFKVRNFSLACFTTGSAMTLLFSSFVLESLWVQQTLGYTPAWAGLTLTPVGVFPLLFYPIMGRLVVLLDTRIWLIASFLLYACTFFWLSRINTEVSFWYLFLPRLVQGIGFPMFTVPNGLTAIRGVKNELLTFVISLFSFSRIMLVGFGVPLGTTLWIHREAFYQSRIVEKTFATNPIFTQFLDFFKPVTSSLDQRFALANVAVENQASTLGLADIYYAYGWIFLGLCVVVLFYQGTNTIAEK